MAERGVNWYKFRGVGRLFVDEADQDYLLARWLLVNGFSGFYWHSCQTIEKYLKAISLLNGVNIRKSGHDLIKLYQNCYTGALRDLILTSFTRPVEVGPEYWRDEQVWGFIQRMGRMGHPDSRYGLTSWYRQTGDLFKLDQLMWNLRRLCVGLDWIVGEVFFPSPVWEAHRGRPYAEVLQEDKDIEPYSAMKNLDRSIWNFGEVRADILHEWNSGFRRRKEDWLRPAPRPVAPYWGPAENSELALMEQHLTGDRPPDPVYCDYIRWVLAAIPVQKEIAAYLKGLLAAAVSARGG